MFLTAVSENDFSVHCKNEVEKEKCESHDYRYGLEIFNYDYSFIQYFNIKNFYVIL